MPAIEIGAELGRPPGQIAQPGAPGEDLAHLAGDPEQRRHGVKFHGHGCALVAALIIDFIGEIGLHFVVDLAPGRASSLGQGIAVVVWGDREANGLDQNFPRIKEGVDPPQLIGQWCKP